MRRSPGRLRFETTGTLRTTSVQLDPPPEVVDQSAAHWVVHLSREQPWVLRIEVIAHRGSDSEERAAIRPRAETVGRPDVVRLARPPIAIVEVQGYAYRARRELAAVLSHLGHHAEAADLVAEAAELRELIRRRYWQPGSDGAPGSFALALDHDKRQVDSITSNMGHLLWCGVPSQQEAEQVATQLASPAMASGWGLRTLSEQMAGYNPISYHVGSVWPHDTVIACEGLRCYGFDDVAMRLAGDLLDALGIFGDRLPELFGGHRRKPGDFPVPYPTACRPQAWAAGVPLAIVALCLGLQPDVPAGTVSLNPVLPKGVHRIELHGIPFPSGELSVTHDGDAPW